MSRYKHSQICLFRLAIIAAVFLILMIPEQAFAGPNDRIVVSFGDSYSSGEGCPPFYGQDSSDKYNEEDWLAHRSENSWEGQLVLGNGTRLKDVKASQLAEGETVAGNNRWYFYASSGAVAVNVYSQDGNPDPGEPYYQSKDVESGIIEHGTPYHIAPFDWDEYKSKVHHDLEIQIDAVLRDLNGDHLNGSDVDYVTMSIGGNDVGFVPIVTEVALRSGFVDRDYFFNAMNTAWYKYDHTVAYQDTRGNIIPSTIDSSGGGRTKKEEIKQCYKRIADEFPNAQILIVGYPTLLDDDEFEEVLARSEKTGLWNRFLTWAGFYKDNVDNAVGFASWESWFVNQNVRRFNSELSMLVTETNDELLEESGSADAARLHFVHVEDVFDGHEAYTKKPYLNSILPTQSEDLALIPPVSSYSMHPNRLDETESGTVSDGISAYREAVQEELTKLEESRPLVAYLDDDPSNSADEALNRKLVTSFHMTYSSKKWPDQAYEERVNASYDKQGNITHKEITRETSFNGWDGEPAYSLDFEYDAAGDLLHVTGVESPGASYSTQVNWNLGYEEGNATLRASGTEGSDSRYINDTYDADGYLVTRDYLIRTGQVLENGTLNLSYDAYGRISGQSANKGYNGDQSSMSRYDMSVTYDGSSRIASIEVLDSSGKLFSRRTYEYDEAGRLASRSHFYDGGSSNLTVKQSYSYNENGHLSSIDQTEGEGWWAPAKATFTTDEDGSIVAARIEGEDYTRTYEVEYVTISTPRGQEPFNAVDLTNPVNPEIYNELWVSHANLDPTPYDESAFLRENRRWLELHDPSEVAHESASESAEDGTIDSKVDSTIESADSVEASAATSEFDGKRYWVVFTEGFRNGRVEASSFNVSSGSPTLVWDESVTVSGATVDGKVSQFRLKDDGEWEKIGEYGIPTDWALEILASNVPIVDSSGNSVDVPKTY